MIRVDKDEESLWFIEKILKQRKKRGKLQYYVRREGIPKTPDCRVDRAEIKAK